MLLMNMLQHFLHHILQLVRTLNGLQNCSAVQLGQRRSNNGRFVVMLANHLHTIINLILTYFISPAKNNSTGVCYLINKELTEILNVHLTLGSIHNCHGAVDLYIQVHSHILHRLQHIGKFSHTGGLNQNTLRRIGTYNLLQRGSKITYQRTADTAGVHLLNLNARLL